MDAVADIYPESLPLSEIVHYLLFQVGYSNYKIRDAIFSQPLDNPFKQRFLPDSDQAFGNVVCDRSQSNALATRKNHCGSWRFHLGESLATDDGRWLRPWSDSSRSGRGYAGYAAAGTITTRVPNI